MKQTFAVKQNNKKNNTEYIVDAKGNVYKFVYGIEKEHEKNRPNLVKKVGKVSKPAWKDEKSFDSRLFNGYSPFTASLIPTHSKKLFYLEVF